MNLALGATAQAAHANDAVARQAIAAIPFFRYADAALRHPYWILAVWIPLLLIPFQTMRARARAARLRHGA